MEDFMKLINVPDIRSPGKIPKDNYILKKEKFGLWSKCQSFSEKVKLIIYKKSIINMRMESIALSD